MKVKKKGKNTPEIPTSSMSDIAFLLIIFFMLTTVFSQEHGLNYQLPDSVKPVELEKKNINITVGADGIFYIEDTPIDLKEIKSYVKAQKLINDEVFAVIKVEPDAPYGYLIDVIDEVIIGGIRENIAFQTTEERLEDFIIEYNLGGD